MSDLIDFSNSPSVIHAECNGKQSLNNAFICSSNSTGNKFLDDVFSFSVDQKPSLDGRESLQILNIANLSDIGDGRESLGILTFAKPGLENNDSDVFCKPLPVASRKISAVSLATASSFCSSYLNSPEISNIPSLHSSQSTSAYSKLDKAFFDEKLEGTTVTSAGSVLNHWITDSRFPEIEARLRLQSLPTTLTTANRHDALEPPITRICKSDNMLNASNSSVQSLNEDNELNDSVFLESRQIAYANGSIIEPTPEEENLLDCTPQPNWEDNSDDGDEGTKPIETEEVLATISKFFPPALETAAQDHNANDSSNRSKCNLSKISNISNKSKSRDAKDMIQNLSDILKSNNISNEKKLAGQSLLHNLAEILCSDEDSAKVEKFDDSGHSSIEQDDAAIEALDLSMKAVSIGSGHALDLSLKGRHRTLDVSNHSHGSDTQSDYTSGCKKVQVASGSILNKFKLKKAEEKPLPIKKGPLKAVIPIMNMARTTANNLKIEITPKRKTPAPSKLKRTSTPVNSGMKRAPVAQSTPEHKTTNQYPLANCSEIKQKKLLCSISPLSRSNNSTRISARSKSELNKSDSVPNLADRKDSTNLLSRRRSASDLKNGQSKVPTKRNYSIGGAALPKPSTSQSARNKGMKPSTLVH